MDPYDFSIKVGRLAGEILQGARTKRYEIIQKGGDPKDIVTSVDMEVNDLIISEIKKTFPGHSIYSEEGGGSIGTTEFEWTIDPIDGTANFSRGIPHFAVCLGLLRSGTPIAGIVYNPITNELFSFKKGSGAFLNDTPIHVSPVTEISKAFVFLRAGRKAEGKDWGAESYRRLLGNVNKTSNMGSSSLDACFVAAGRIEANIYGTLSVIDIAPAIGILAEAGGVFSTSDGEPLQLSLIPQRIYMANNATMLSTVRSLLES